MPPKQWYPNNENYPFPSFDSPTVAPSVDPDEGATVSVAFNPAWLPYIMGALDQLVLMSTWEGNEEEIKEAVARAVILKNLFALGGSIPAPFWDNAEDNEAELPAETQIWYGAVTDWLAPVDSLNFVQNIALWALTGFVAYAAGVGSAIFFRTTAKRFIIALEVGDVPEIIRVVVDSAEFNVDTTGMDTGTIIRQVVLADESLEEHDIYIMKGDF